MIELIAIHNDIKILIIAKIDGRPVLSHNCKSVIGGISYAHAFLFDEYGINIWDTDPFTVTHKFS